MPPKQQQQQQQQQDNRTTTPTHHTEEEGEEEGRRRREGKMKMKKKGYLDPSARRRSVNVGKIHEPEPKNGRGLKGVQCVDGKTEGY